MSSSIAKAGQPNINISKISSLKIIPESAQKDFFSKMHVSVINKNVQK